VIGAGALVSPGDVVGRPQWHRHRACRPGSSGGRDGEEARRSETEKRAKLAVGVLGLDMYEMRGPLESARLRYID